MNFKNSITNIWGASVLALGLSFALSAPAYATSINVALNNLDGVAAVDANGGLSIGGSPTGNATLTGMTFEIDNIASTDFSAIIAGPAQVDLALTLNGNVMVGNYSRQVNIDLSNRFNSGADLYAWLYGAGAFGALSTGSVSGIVSSPLSDIYARPMDLVGTGTPPNQTTTGYLDLVTTVPNLNVTGHGRFTGEGTFSLSQVPVPAPATLGLFALGIAGLGLMRRRRNGQS